jgi:hypothetical protein
MSPLALVFPFLAQERKSVYKLERFNEKYSRSFCDRRGLVRGFSSEAAAFPMLPELEGPRNGLRRCKGMAIEVIEPL